MNSNEFEKYIKELNATISEKDRIILGKYISAVKEIENYNYKFEGNIGPPYFKKIMLPDDYRHIEINLIAIRTKVLYTIRRNKMIYLRKLEYSEEDIKKNLIYLEDKLVKKLRLSAYRDRYKNLIIKDSLDILTCV